MRRVPENLQNMKWTSKQVLVFFLNKKNLVLRTFVLGPFHSLLDND